MVHKFRSIFVEILAGTFGKLFVLLQPEKAHSLSEKGMTLSLDGNLTLKERLMRRAILKNIEKTQEYDKLAGFHQNYWTKQGDIFFSTVNDNFETHFLPDCSFIFELLKQQLSNDLDEFNTLVEFGTGTGSVLNYLSSEFNNINKFVGIDLSPIQIEMNRKKFVENNKLEFVAMDGFEWVKKYGRSNTIFVTSGGVLEYFTEERLQALLIEINRLGKTIFIAMEPNGIEHNFETNPNTEIYGSERSFSHNYPKLFRNAGFSLWHLSHKPFDESSIQSFIGAKN